MDAVKQNYFGVGVQTLDELNCINENHIWIKVFPGWKYCPEIPCLAQIDDNDDNIINLDFYFGVDKIQNETDLLKIRIAILDGSYHFLKDRNPTLTEYELQVLLLKHFEQLVNEKQTNYAFTRSKKIN